MISTALTLNPFLYLVIPMAFLLGSIPFGILFTRGTGIDLRSTGSRNIGATNVLRSAGKTPALFTLLCDMLKGLAPVLICRYIILHLDFSAYEPGFYVVMEEFWTGIAALSAVLGHMFSVFLSFRGGKGVATGFGVLSGYSPAAAGIMLLIWISVAAIFRISSLAAISAVIALPFILILFKASTIKISFSVILAALIIFKHKSNIQNLLAGKESRIGNKR